MKTVTQTRINRLRTIKLEKHGLDLSFGDVSYGSSNMQIYLDTIEMN